MLTKIKHNTITIPSSRAKKGDLVVISRKEYEEMKSNTIPSIYLSGKKASELDKRVSKAVSDHKAGKTKKINSLADVV